VRITSEYFFPEVSAKLATAFYARRDVYARFYHSSLLLSSYQLAWKKLLFNDLV